MLRIRGWGSWQLLLAGLLSATGASPVLASSASIPGFDASSHVAKTAFLMYSFSHGNFLGWSQFWYSGFQLFYTYSPLTHLLAAGFGWPFSSALFGMKVVLVLSFLLSGVGAYALARDFGVSPNWSLVAALLYSLASPHRLIVFFDGSLTYGLAFAFAPFLFLTARIALRTRSLTSVISFGATIALLLFSNSATAYVLAFPLLTYFLISIHGPRTGKSVLVIASAAFVGLLLSAFWFVPYLELDLSGQLNLVHESGTGAFAAPYVIQWYSFFIPDFANQIAGDVGWVLLLPALASIVFIRRREESALYAAGVVSFLMTIGPTLTPLFYKIPLYLALQFSWRFLIADLLLLAPLAALFFWRLSLWLSSREVMTGASRSGILAVALLLLLVLIPLTSLYFQGVPSNYYPTQQTPADPSQKEAYDFLASQPGFFRVMVMDRSFQAFPEYTGKGSIDGWYDQAATVAYRGFTFIVYHCGATEKVLDGLRLLGARYVMVDYGYGRDATSPIQAYNTSRSVFGPPVFENGEFRIYQVPDSHLVYVSAAVSTGQLSFSQQVDCNKLIPSTPKEVNYSLANFDWTETRISFDLSVNQSSYVLLSNSYSSGWDATDNGSPVPILLSPPGLPVIQVAPGTHHIVFFYSSTLIEQVSLALSAVTLAVLLVLVIRRRGRPVGKGFDY